MIDRFPDAPPRIKRLPRSAKGFPVPWFVQWIDGEPDFRVVDGRKVAPAVKHGFCWTCGGPLGTRKAFVIGPMCGINRTISEPPSHRDCAIFAATSCPFLSSPQARRRADGLPEERREAPGFHLDRNPGAAGVWITKSYTPFRAHMGNAGVLFEIGDPVEVLWFAHGRPATRSEVLHSIETGLPRLQAIAAEEGPEALAVLADQVRAFQPLLPAEVAA
jgi:hypothetical protein